MDNKTLLGELVKSGDLSEEKSRLILQESSTQKRNAEDILYDRRMVTEVRILEAKSRILKIPYKSAHLEEIDQNLLKIVPEETVRNYRVVPLEKNDTMLVLGMVNADDAQAREAAKFVAKQQGMNLGIYLVGRSLWESVLHLYSPFRSEVERAVQSLNLGRYESKESRLVQLEQKTNISEEAPIITIVASALREAVFQRASDIHIEPMRNSTRVRLRIDGDLQQVAELPMELHQPVVSRVKVLSNLKIDETRIPQDGRFRTVALGRDIDFRVATFPTPLGEKVAIRVLDPQVGIKGLEELGLQKRNYDLVVKGIEKPYGMALVTGPTGSGKTTTLYAVMQLLNKEKVNIVSLEDPVEYFIDGLNQSQVKPEIGYTFASGLRQILRQDPDVIMVGEIRDEETAELAVHAALTGHIVLSTLHTNNAIGVIPRLIDMKIAPFLVPSSLNLIMGQRLVSRLCQKCKTQKKISPEVEAIIKKELTGLPEDAVAKNTPLEFYFSPGCEACKGKGVSGRVALFEVFQMTPELEAIIGEQPSENRIFEEAKRQGMITMRQDGIVKALQGLVSIEEVLRETTEM